MTGSRRLSQAISEGDGISLIVPIVEPANAADAEQEGADAVIAEQAPGAVREATSLPLLCRAGELTAADAREAGADGYVISVSATDDEHRLRELHLEAQTAGLEPVLAVSDEDELEIALEYIDPEIFLLTPRGRDAEEQLEGVLDLLPDVPAGKLAIADIPGAGRDSVLALERAGVDGVIVAAPALTHVAGDEPPDV